MHFEHVKDGYTLQKAHVTPCRGQPFQVLARLHPTSLPSLQGVILILQRRLLNELSCGNDTWWALF